MQTKRLWLGLAVCVAAGLCVGSPALADDIRIPDWRGTDGSVLAVFDNWSEANGIYMPDSFEQWPSQPSIGGAEAEIMDGPAGNVLATYEGRSNVLEMDKNATLLFLLDNFEWDNPQKIVQVQITYHDNGCWPFWLYVEYGWGNDSDKFNTPIFELEDKAYYVLEDGWKVDVFSFTIEPNPRWEEVEIKFLEYGASWKTVAYIDQVIIDTICIPEPAALSLLALGGLTLIRRRR